MADDARQVLHLEICTPERTPVRLEASEAIVPGALGVFTVLPGHTPLLATLGVGVLIAHTTAGEDRFFAINGGFAEVAQDRIIVLATTAESDHEIDPSRAEAARERAEQRLKPPLDEDVDMARAEMALRRALARLDAHRRVGI